MRKTLFTLLMGALFAPFMAQATDFSYSTNTETYTPNCNANSIYGFYFTPSSNTLIQNEGSGIVSGDIILSSISILCANGNQASFNAHGLLVLNANDSTVLGKSTGTQTGSSGSSVSFSLQDTYGSSLVLNSSSSYRFLMVSGDVLSLIGTDNDKTYLYSAGGTSAASSSTDSDTVTVSQGLVGTSVRGYAATDISNSDLLFIGNTNGKTIYSTTISGSLYNLMPDLTITGSLVPEPTAASLGLLGLGSLLLRRRRA